MCLCVQVSKGARILSLDISVVITDFWSRSVYCILKNILASYNALLDTDSQCVCVCLHTHSPCGVSHCIT